MKYRRLGASGVKVSEISLGSWLTYGGYVERENAVKAIYTAYDQGINFFDTANVYEQGAAETLLGETIQAFPRSTYVLATKAFGKMGDGPNDKGLSRKHLTDQFHASLKRLAVDYVDIMYCHRHDPETPLYETLRTLDDLVRQGKVLYVGVSEWTPSQIAEAHAIADRYLLDRIVVNQPVYNMFNRYIEQEIIPYSERSGVGQVVFSPLAQGLLTGKYNSVTDFPQDSRAAKLEGVRKGITESNIAKVQQLSKIAAELNLSVGQLALAWILRQPNVSSALVGASRPEQVTQNVQASGVTIPEDVLIRIEEILA
ncbi:aryl-alcohol dehydrogenase-like predicted oxidoreductase [Paenibacillus shirakamiensis]|uniref:Aryl-alcohol dehydrogenase-like predicted oxidoreductase n=1 Tax=Paenibacillus shirakamiensis TaxID=1265935 RepID=A0ABS4JJW4_9BACL|nr:aldo/keto reductase family protein [Paenibacillus shirakamiensis]MBP2001994.1 aryl-alcohol dehydrogenase-like predicted oxidoreductase [Paenibacillus shirakamiensis]